MPRSHNQNSLYNVLLNELNVNDQIKFEPERECKHLLATNLNRQIYYFLELVGKEYIGIILRNILLNDTVNHSLIGPSQYGFQSKTNQNNNIEILNIPESFSTKKSQNNVKNKRSKANVCLNEKYSESLENIKNLLEDPFKYPSEEISPYDAQDLKDSLRLNWQELKFEDFLNSRSPDLQFIKMSLQPLDDDDFDFGSENEQSQNEIINYDKMIDEAPSENLCQAKHELIKNETAKPKNKFTADSSSENSTPRVSEENIEKSKVKVHPSFHSSDFDDLNENVVENTEEEVTSNFWLEIMKFYIQIIFRVDSEQSSI